MLFHFDHELWWPGNKASRKWNQTRRHGNSLSAARLAIASMEMAREALKRDLPDNLPCSMSKHMHPALPAPALHCPEARNLAML